MITNDELLTRFNYIAPTGTKINKHADVRQACLDAARTIVINTPACREQSSAITKLEEAMFFANAAIARNPEVK